RWSTDGRANIFGTPLRHSATLDENCTRCCFLIFRDHRNLEARPEELGLVNFARSCSRNYLFPVTRSGTTRQKPALAFASRLCALDHRVFCLVSALLGLGARSGVCWW